MSTFLQSYATIKDLTSPGARNITDAALAQAILPASEYLAQEIGVCNVRLQTVKIAANNRHQLFLPPFTRIVSITSDGVSVPSTDYELSPGGAWWPHGPYTSLTLVSAPTAISEWSRDPGGVVITAYWGIYERTEASGASLVAAIADTDAALDVTNAAPFSAGALLQVEDEHLLVNGLHNTGALLAQLDGGITPADDVIALDAAGDLSVGETILIDVERLLVLDVQGNNVRVLRAADGTAAATHADETPVYVLRTLRVTRALNGTTAAAHADQTPISLVLPHPEVGYLARQIATLMLNKAATGYGGRAGNTDVGDIYYNFEFPRDAIMRIKNQLRVMPAR